MPMIDIDTDMLESTSHPHTQNDAGLILAAWIKIFDIDLTKEGWAAIVLVENLGKLIMEIAPAEIALIPQTPEEDGRIYGIEFMPAFQSNKLYTVSMRLCRSATMWANTFGSHKVKTLSFKEFVDLTMSNVAPTKEE